MSFWFKENRNSPFYRHQSEYEYQLEAMLGLILKTNEMLIQDGADVEEAKTYVEPFMYGSNLYLKRQITPLLEAIHNYNKYGGVVNKQRVDEEIEKLKELVKDVENANHG